jgi:effector-binding domain-containing protein
MDKKMGKDFDEGLALLKLTIEKMNGTAVIKNYEVNTMNFPATTFAAVRQVVKWSDLTSFYMQHYPILFEEVKKANASSGSTCSLFYSWDEKNQQTDVAAAVPVGADFKTSNNIIQTVNIPASKAVYINYYGAYNKLPDAYSSIRKYIADNKLEEISPSIEQYIIDPSGEKDTTKWLTKVVFLVK